MGVVLPRTERGRVAGSERLASARLGLAALALSAASTFAVAVAGVSVMEPALPGRPGQPPWALSLHLSPYLAVGLTALALASGTIGMVLVLRAVRAGWRIRPGVLLLAGIGVAAVLTLVPPFGSSDHLSYAAYGRMVVTGHNPWLTTPEQLARLGDPVARAVQDWYRQPSVYGPLASGFQALASLAGGTSVRLTVFILGLLNLLAFGLTGWLLYRLTSGDQGRQLRAVLLWTANPLLLHVLVAGAHVDTLAIVFGVAAVAVLYGGTARSAGLPGMVRALLAGALVGCGFAIKVTGALIGLALAIAVVQAARRETGGASSRRAVAPLAGLAIGFGVTAAIAVAIGGSAMVRAESQASDMVSIGSPWRVIRMGLDSVTGHAAATDAVKYGAVALAVALAVLIARRGQAATRGTGEILRPDGATTAGPVPAGAAWLLVAVTVGWLFAWPYVLPWYDALGWAFLALVPASTLDWLMLARTAALALGYLPARTADVSLPSGLSWLQPAFRHGIAPAVLAVTTAWLAVVVWRSAKEPWRSS